MICKEVEIEFVTPAIVSTRVSDRGYVAPSSYIAATTVRGALLSSLLYHGYVDEELVAKEAERPSVIASPAYPLSGEGKRALPATLLHIRCKVCKEVRIPQDFRITAEGIEGAETLCRNGHPAVESPHPKPVYLSGEKGMEDANVSCESPINVGMSRYRASAAGKMLYIYEAISPKSRFWFRVVSLEDVEVPSQQTLWLGRGITRGFGEARMRVRSEISFEGLAERMRDASREGRELLFYSLSPIARVDGDKYCGYPSRVDLYRLSAKRRGGELRIRNIYGRPIDVSLGWSITREREGERPNLFSVAPMGSLVVASPHETSPEDLAMLFLAGTVEDVLGSPITGLNMLGPAELALGENL
ncbi:MAG: hypothetical protein NXY59_00050 [Aigarchaeota archaeon]|nr:hypothetical protein [Candidatus Pelearchaeum maunauluense]